jgi:hypothetical protein
MDTLDHINISVFTQNSGWCQVLIVEGRVVDAIERLMARETFDPFAMEPISLIVTHGKDILMKANLFAESQFFLFVFTVIITHVPQFD